MPKLTWQALEYKKKEKTVDWYWAVAVIVLSIAIIAIILGDGLFAIFIIVATITLLIFSAREPQWFEVTIDPRGFVIGRDHYPFANLDEFWVDITEKDSPKLILKSKKLTSPLIIIPIEGHDHLDVRAFLLNYLPEAELHEPLSHKIMERLGF
jgi:hypothetical protein